jgi:hypothetical protein
MYSFLVPYNIVTNQNDFQDFVENPCMYLLFMYLFISISERGLKIFRQEKVIGKSKYLLVQKR